MFDQLNRFSNDQDISANADAGTQSTNVIDLGTGDNALDLSDIWPKYDGRGEMRLRVVVTEAFVAAVDGANLNIALYEHTAATSINSGNKIVEKNITVNIAGQAVGTVLVDLPLPTTAAPERYLGVYYAVTLQNITTASVSAFLTPVSEEGRYR
jgi:hypothetical protein